MRANTRWASDEPILVTEGSGLTAIVAPERGAKIISLVDGRGVEWLGQPDRSVGPPARAGDDFLSAEMAGWDECAPAIVGCTVDGITVRDHGELWITQFATTDTGVSAYDETFGYLFTRDIVSTATGLRIEYRVETAERSIPFLWAAHPQFLATPGTIVRLPNHVTTVVDVLAPGLPRLDWHEDLGSIDRITSGGYRKLYVSPDEPVHSAGLVRPDGSELTLSWSDECPYLGVWLDRFSFRSEAIIALEPTTSYFDSLATAIELGRTPTIHPDTPLSWWVELSVTA